MYPKIAIIILNWNGWKDTIECLESIYHIDYPNYDVIVVDNHSDNDSIHKINDYCKGNIQIVSKFTQNNPKLKPIDVLEYDQKMAENGGNLERELLFSSIKDRKLLRLIKAESNNGFSEGNNIGIKYALKSLNPDYILLLNNDTIVDKKLLELALLAKKDKRIGIFGPKINYYEPHNKIFSIGGKINSVTGNNYAITSMNKKYKIDYISGCAIFIKREVFEKIGLLPTEYFMYSEELDYCENAKRNNFMILNYLEATVWHKISASSDNAFVKYYRTRNRFIFMKKYSSHYTYIAFLSWRLTIDFLIEIAFLVYRRDYNVFKSYIKGLYDGIRLKNGIARI